MSKKKCLKFLAVERKDVLGVLPTGYGKSLIYQLLPKLLSNHWLSKTKVKKTFTVIVVSPLELIRKQQVERMISKGICAATIEELNSEDDHSDKEILFGSAESWLSDNWRRQLTSGSLKNVEFLVVDEVHTVETWGKGKKGKAAFRQAFGNVKDLRSFLGQKPVLALTATANKSLRERLCKALGFKGNKELILSPNKENIRFTALEADKSLSCFDWLVDMVKEKKAETPHTIIFCHTVNDIVMVLSTLLTKLGDHAYLEGGEQIPNRCILSVYYSATPDSAKNRVTSSFTGSGSARVVIASTSLSMGVDFPHVRYVIHFGPGRTLADHLQQAGRAGRDSDSAFNVIMYLGKHVGVCEDNMRNVVKKKECIRKLLFCHFTDDDTSTVTPMHNCCNRCHILCTCDGNKCIQPVFPFDKLPLTTKEAEKVRQVTDDDKNCLSDALQEIKQSLSSCTRATFFDTSGVLCHGFSDSVIKSIVDNSNKIFTLTDLMETGFISSLELAVMVLEVFSELFEDITLDSSLYRLAVDSGSIYNELMDSAQYEIDLEQWSDDQYDDDNAERYMY